MSIKAEPGRVRGRRQPPPVDPEWLSATIGSIYDCVLFPERWSATIGAIATKFSFADAALGLVRMRSGAGQIMVTFGYSPERLEEWARIGDRYAEDTVNLWGGRNRALAFPLDEPIVASEVRSPAEFAQFAYYRDYLEPRGFVEGVMIALARDGELAGYLGLNRHRSAGPITAAELDGMRLVTPHLRRAVTISNLFDLREVERTTFSSVLDAMNCAVLLLEEDLAVVHANRLAKEMLAGGRFLAMLDGAFGVSDPLAQDALVTSVRLSARDETLLTQRGIGIPVQHAGVLAAGLHVLPLYRGEIRPGLVQRAVAAVFVVPAGLSSAPAVDAISLIYDLTPAERGIFSLVAQGRSLADAATTLGVAKSTARTHLLRVFEKTGCRRQAELVALAAQLRVAI